MMKWVIPFICFCAGGSFGILTMCCQYDEADGPDGGVCGDDVPAAPETGEGPESE